MEPLEFSFELPVDFTISHWRVADNQDVDDLVLQDEPTSPGTGSTQGRQVLSLKERSNPVEPL
jgi:hypothetical protein